MQDDMKGMLKTAGKFVGVFLVILIAMYFLYPYLHPENNENTVEEDEWGTSDFTPNPFDYSLEAADSLKTQITQLRQLIDSLRIVEQQQQVKVDSLERLASQMEEEARESDTPEVDDDLVSAERLKDVSRSLLELDEEELSPILDRLDNNELIGLYKSANNMQRSKMLRSLGSNKAAVILKEII